MKESRWRTESRRVITEALASGRAIGLEGKALEKHVSNAYPFGERAMTPYKIWRHVFAQLVRGVNKPMESHKKKGPKTLGEWPMTEEQKEFFGK